ncbi:MAG TPA: methylmalonyl-CoA epimerase [Candidatus Dormibacteraeota bacterium]
MIERVSHLGIAVTDLEAAIRLYRDVFGLEPSHRWVAEADRMEACSFDIGGVEIELMQPLEADSPVGKFIAKRGEGIHHVAFRVDDVAAALRRAQEAGLEPIDREPREGGDGRTRIGFLHPKSTQGVLMELEEDVGD